MERAAAGAAQRVSVASSAEDLRAALATLDVEHPNDGGEVVQWIAGFLDDSMVHTTSPRYYGLFNPTPTFMGVVGELIAAAYNPQLAAWSHAPGPVEMEAWLVSYVAERLGFPTSTTGCFTSGGAEANAMAVHTSLTATYPSVGHDGLRSLPADPIIYVSAESHDSWSKIAHVTSLGRGSVRKIPVRSDLRLDTDALETAIRADDASDSRQPLLVVATAGTTSAGVIDDLPAVVDVTQRSGIRLHVDAAWGGAAAMSDALRPALAGIEAADSVTVDAHKWLSVPMGAGLFIVSDDRMLDATYHVSASYMPAEVGGARDPYTSTNQWSRRFMGLKLFTTLATVGREGYQAQLEHDAQLADLLRKGLTDAGWSVVNETVLPVVCFVEAERPADEQWHRQIVERVVASNEAWISMTKVDGRPAIRACITSHRTTDAHIKELVGALNEERSALLAER